MKIMRPVAVPAEKDWQAWIDLLQIQPCSQLLESISVTLCDYLEKNNLTCFVLGVSGGIDSSFLAALLHRDDIPFVCFSLPLATNSLSEKERAAAVAGNYTSSYGRSLHLPAVCDFADLYNDLHARFSAVAPSNAISRGNLQARLRMMFLYHMAHSLGGCVVSTDQLDEFLTGFWTVHGDVGDVSPLQLLPKTTEYALARLLLPQLRDPVPLQAAIDAVPTDGLGISSSSLEQLGVESYAALEAVFLEYFLLRQREDEKKCAQQDRLRLEELTNTLPVQRFLASSFKRRGSLLFWPEAV